jgi:hypothetical protein
VPAAINLFLGDTNMRSRFAKSLSLAAVLSALLLAASAPRTLHAQESRGRITGTVTDPNKAAVPGASVKITDPSRGTSVSLSTNSEGLFQAPYLLPGTYQVVIEVAGFKKFIQDNVELRINETRDLDIILEVGGTEETVTVTAGVTELNRADANLGQTIDNKRVAELPLVHGDPYKLMGLAPGVAHTGSQRLDRPFEPTHIVGYAIDGTRGNRSDLLIDGISSTSTANANEVIASYVPPTDIIQEFKVQTATFDAQFGNTEGGVTSISIKSGTNDYHGSLYIFTEPGGLSANDFFGNKRGQGRPFTYSNRPGFVVNGPVRIPKLYDGRDKTFFLFGFEAIRDARPRFDAGQDVWVPTAALRNGDFSAFACAPGQTSNCITIYDPLTRAPVGGGQFAGQPFPGNIIPQNRISPVARAFLDFYSLPKGPGLTGNIFDSTLTEITKPYDNYTFRVDQNVSDNNRFFVRGSWYDRLSHYNDYVGSEASGTLFRFLARQGVLDDVHTFNATTVLNVRYGYNRFIRDGGQELDAQNFDLERLNFPAAYNTLIPESSRRFPRFDFPAGTMLGVAFGGDFRPTTTHTVAAVMNKALEAHSVKFGTELRIYREDSLPIGNDRSGHYIYNNNFTRQNSASGTDFQGLQAYASFLLGLASTTQVVRASDYSEYSKTWGFFVQDDWRVSNRLTLNLGLRYEVETALVERNNKSVSGFDFDYVHPFEGTARTRYAALNDPLLKAQVPQINVRGGLMFAGVDTGSGLYETPKNVFLPRLGFAYQWNDRTVIRGGFGLFAGFLGQRRGDVIQPGYSRTTVVSTTTNANGAPIPVDIQTAFLNNAIQEPVGNALGRQTGLGGTISFFNQNPQVSKQARWQIGFQHELPGGWIAEAVYVGNRGYDIEIVRNINALPNQYLNTDNFRSAAMVSNNAFLTASVANPFVGLFPAGSGLQSSTIARQQLLRPFPAFGDINTTNNDGESWYHSGQFRLEKRFTKGYTVGAAYTWSKWLQATEYLNAADPEPTRMISDQDVPHRLSLSAMYSLPFGRNREFLSNANWLVNALVGGWQIQGIYAYQSGFPIRFANDAFYDGTDLSINNPTTDRWFNTSPFTSVLNATSTNATPLFHLRTLPFHFSNARRDSINNIDLSLIKDIHVREQMRVQLRFEAINAFNEAYFPGPVVNPTSATFGQISTSNQENYARRVQLAAKFIF